MKSFARLIYGSLRFEEFEEYQEFRYRFFTILVWLGGISSGYFLIGAATGANRLPFQDLLACGIHVGAVLITLAGLRFRKKFFTPLILFYGAVSFYLIATALLVVENDELRVIWVFLNIPPYYIMLGRPAGIAASALSFGMIVAANSHSTAPYSRNAIATFMISIVYISAVFFVYSEKNLSFFRRMRDSKLKLEELASADPLTGVLNARAYCQIADSHISLAQRSGAPCSVLFIDLDHFKAINDTYGHEAGDRVLKAVTRALRASIRESDLLGRVGGEEFSVFLPGTGAENAERLAEKLLGIIGGLAVDAGGRTLRVTASIGVASRAEKEAGISGMQARADQAMYEAKQAGRNRVRRAA